MRIIIKIAKLELRQLFYSPIGWLLAIILMVMSAVFYTNLMFQWSKEMLIYQKFQPNFFLWLNESITAFTYSKTAGSFFASMLPHLYLFVPLLTMGIINKEFNSGTIRMLYSSPVKLRQIIAGKYLAMLVYNLLLIGIIGIFVVLGFFNIKSLDFPLLLSGLLGQFLLLAALTAIGFFMSSLTSYQIVSAISSFTILFILSRIGTLWQQHEFVRDLTWFISISGRTEKFLIGLIRSKDILYYLIIIFLFLGFTYLKLQDGLESRRWYVKTMRYLSVVAIGLGIGYLGSRPVTTLYLDTTAQQNNTLHPRTQQLLSELNEGPLEVTLYVNLFASAAGKGFPSMRNQYLAQLWEPYQRFKKDISFNYEYYYALPKGKNIIQKKYPGKTLKQLAGITAKAAQVDSTLFKAPEEMPNLAELEKEDFELLLEIKYKDRSTMLRTYGPSDTWPNQQNMNAGFSRLLNKPIPEIYFISGQLERSIYKKGEREYYPQTIKKEERASLINTGFDVDSLNLVTQDIPSSASMLVLADPRMDLPPIVQTKLQQYIRNGGNMIILGEPGKQQVVNPLLAETGVQLRVGQLVQPNKQETPDKIWSYLEPDVFELAEIKEWIQKKFVRANGVRTDTAWTGHTGAAALSVVQDNGFTIKPLVMTKPNESWLKTGKFVTDSTALVFNPAEGDSKDKSYSVMLQLTRMIGKKEQRIIISGDADIMSRSRGNPDLALGCYSWVNYNLFPVYTPVPYAQDNQLTLSPQNAKIQQIIFTWVVPSLMLIAAIVVLIRRKRK